MAVVLLEKEKEKERTKRKVSWVVGSKETRLGWRRETHESMQRDRETLAVSPPGTSAVRRGREGGRE